MTKKAILAVSFGTTFPETRQKTIEATEKAIGDAFPDYDVFRAFTSRIVRQRIEKNERIQIDDVDTALSKLCDEGYTEVYVQSLHVIPGIEYNLVWDAVNRYKEKFLTIKVTAPLLETFEDFQHLVAFLQKQSEYLPSGKAVLWMGHGTAHSAFTTYACLDHMLYGSKSYVGAVESYPDINDEIKRLRHAHINKAYLQPLMMVAGNHAHNDMASDDPKSWKSILKENGITAHPVLKGLGEFPEIQNMFITKLKTVIREGGQNG